MKSYKIYLTESPEAAAHMADSFTSGERKMADIDSVTHGKVDAGNELIPAIYHDQGFFYCAVELSECNEDGKQYAPEYELIFC